MTSYKQSPVPALLAVFGIVVLAVVAILAVTALRPREDNTNLITNLMSILLPTTIALLAYLKGTENATSIHDVGRENALAIDATKTIAKESKEASESNKAIVQENKAAIQEVGDRVNGKLAQLLEEARKSAHAEGVIEGLKAQLRGESAVVEIGGAAKPESATGVNMAKAAPGKAE